ncbi:MAG: DNA polymerase IV [Lachnospiraceae bacterium]|nr:DNA polymerase IV [Lachnospiraceae bacterium]
MEPIFFHIDVNSAFLSWTAVERLEQGDPLDLRLIPSIIGGDKEKRHGIVLAKSVPAKVFNIQTGEPIVKALEKCSALTIAAPDHAMYQRRSRILMDYLKTLTPEIEQVSIDECYMDFSSIVNQYPSAIDAAHLIKDTIYNTMGFTVNIGISDCKVLAKMASDFKKPNLVHTLYRHEIKEKMWPLPVSSLFMCGKSSVEELRKLEILTIGDLACADPDIISLHLKSHGRLLWEFANGIDDSKVEPIHPDAKGIGNSTTLAKDAEDLSTIHEVLLSLSDSVAARIRKAESLAYMVSVEVKYNTFVKNSHQTTLSTPTNTSDTIYKTACRLFDELWDGTPVRLLGIRCTKLVDIDEPVQMSLMDYDFNEKDEKSKKLDSALDSIRKRYGSSAVVRGSMLKNK